MPTPIPHNRSNWFDTYMSWLLNPSRFGGGSGSGISGHSTLAAKIIAHWKMNETSGTRVDSHASNDLTDGSSVGYATGKIGNAVDFDGSTDYLYIADNADISFGDEDFSFTFWWNPDNVALNREIFAKGGTAEYRVMQRSDGKIRLNVLATSVDSTETLSAGTWYFVHAYHDAAGNVMGVSINNGTPNTLSHSSGCTDGSGDLVFGARNASTNYVDGQLDSVSFWNALLTSGELADLYNSGAGLDY